MTTSPTPGANVGGTITGPGRSLPFMFEKDRGEVDGKFRVFVSPLQSNQSDGTGKTPPDAVQLQISPDDGQTWFVAPQTSSKALTVGGGLCFDVDETINNLWFAVNYSTTFVGNSISYLFASGGV
jgi:hypothetical protein